MHDDKRPNHIGRQKMQVRNQGNCHDAIAIGPEIIGQIQKPRDPDRRKDKPLQDKVGRGLKRVVFAPEEFLIGVFLALEDAIGVKPGHREHPFDLWDELPPCAGRKEPERGENPQGQKRKRRHRV